MSWDNVNKPFLELPRNSWNSWTPLIMQRNHFLNSLHSLVEFKEFLLNFFGIYIYKHIYIYIYIYILEIQKVTFSMCFLKCFGILNLCAYNVHADSGQPQKCQGKLFFHFNSVNTLLKYQHQQNLWTTEICILCFCNLNHLVLILFGLNFVMALTLCTVWH